MKQFRGHFGALCLLFLVSCSRTYQVAEISSQYVDLKSPASGQRDSVTDLLLKPYRDSVSKTMDQVIGQSLQPMERGKPESILGNFVSDVCKDVIDSILLTKEQKPTDLFVFNTGGLRGAFPKGEIKLRDVYQVMPFDNELVWIDIPYDSLISLIQYIKDKGGIPIAGANMTLSADIGKCLIFNNQKSISPGGIYRIGTNDFLARGGDGMNMLSTENEIPTTGIKVRDAILNYILKMNEQNKLIKVELDGRIIQ
jgi:2',3'-cyclic-nucleotide 2'-phosphodiesterase (5'-nucleotidase family)